MRRSLLGASFITACVLAASANAATLKVPQQFGKFQDAIDAASAGDTILVAAGTYKANLSIPPGKEGLTVRGLGKVIVDARPLGSSGSGAGIGIGADGVRIINITTRLAEGGLVGAGIVVVANGVVLKNVTALSCEKAGMILLGNDHVLDRCRAIACEASGIVVTGANVTVNRCVVRQCDSSGILIAGSGAHVTKSDVQTIEDDSGIEIVGDFAVVADNFVSGTDGPGISVRGSGFEIRRNRVHAGPDSDGIEVDDSLGGTIDGNTCMNCFESGIAVLSNCAAIVVSKNKVLRCGAETSNAIDISGDQCTITDNVVVEAESDGIFVDGADCVVRGNKITRCYEDGIEVDGLGALVEKNVVKDCSAEGIENNASGADFVDNVMKNNRIDFANSTTVGDFTGNVYASGGVMTTPEING